MTKGRFIYDRPERRMPNTQELASGHKWVLENSFAFIRPNGQRIFVPQSGITLHDILTKPVWTTDYGSIPRPLQNIFSPTEYGDAYILHDWLFAAKLFSKSESNTILGEALEVSAARPGWLARNTIVAGVRIGSGSAWRSHSTSRAFRLRGFAEMLDA